MSSLYVRRFVFLKSNAAAHALVFLFRLSSCWEVSDFGGCKSLVFRTSLSSVQTKCHFSIFCRLLMPTVIAPRFYNLGEKLLPETAMMMT